MLCKIAAALWAQTIPDKGAARANTPENDGLWLVSSSGIKPKHQAVQRLSAWK